MGGKWRTRLMLAGLSACTLAGTAAAQTTPGTFYANQPPPAVLSIPVTASVGGSCGFASAPTATYNFPNLDTGFTADTGFVLNCNGRSRIAVVSVNGGLQANETAPTGYTTLAPYTVTVRMAGNTGAPVEASCDAATLKLSSGSACGFRGTAGFSTGLELGVPSNGQPGSYVRVSAPIYSGINALVASSSYSDTLTVTLSASL